MGEPTTIVPPESLWASGETALRALVLRRRARQVRENRVRAAAIARLARQQSGQAVTDAVRSAGYGE